MKTLFALILTVCSVQASARVHGKILRNPDGTIRHMSLYSARKACPAGAHIPSVRELCEISQAAGAKGILELSEAKSGTTPIGYLLVSVVNADGKKDQFYFIDEGYDYNRGGLGNDWYWSTSVVSKHPAYFFTMLGEFGGLWTDYKGAAENGAAVCVSGR